MYPHDWLLKICLLPYKPQRRNTTFLISNSVIKHHTLSKCSSLPTTQHVTKFIKTQNLFVLGKTSDKRSKTFQNMPRIILRDLFKEFNSAEGSTAMKLSVVRLNYQDLCIFVTTEMKFEQDWLTPILLT